MDNLHGENVLMGKLGDREWLNELADQLEQLRDHSVDTMSSLGQDEFQSACRITAKMATVIIDRLRTIETGD